MGGGGVVLTWLEVFAILKGVCGGTELRDPVH